MWSIRFRVHSHVPLAVLLLALPLLTVAARAAEVTLQYRAFVAGAPVGEASVDVALVNGEYRVQGWAISNGWLRGFSNWRNRFAAHGRLDGLERLPAAFSYSEQDSNKERNVTVKDGTLLVVKDGKARPERPAPPFPDIISGLFVQPHCQGDQVLSTGRHVYRLTRLQRDPGGCRYAVIDDDDDTFEIELVLGRRNDLVVPLRIQVDAWLTGWVELQETQQ